MSWSQDKMWRRSVATGWLVALAVFSSLAAQTKPDELAITGRVSHPRTLSLAELRKMPTVTVHLTQKMGDRTQDASFTGVLLWPLITTAEPVDDPGKGAKLQHVILARGADGYAVAVAIGELNPEFEGKQVLIAYQQDGKELPTLRLVVPGDQRGGRGVHDLTAIEIR